MIAPADRLPPHDERAEQAVVAALFYGAAEQLLADLAPEDFYVPKHAEVFAAAQRLHAAGSVLDFLTVSSELERAGRLERIGGIAELARLTAFLETAYHAEHYGALVREAAVRRRVIRAAGALAGAAWDERQDLTALQARAAELLDGLATAVPGQRGPIHVSVALQEELARLEEVGARRGEPVGVPTGLRDLDRLTGGWQDSDLIVLAGRPGAGKTAFALRLACQAALQAQVPVLLFSLEMSYGQVTQRLLAAESGVPSDQVRRASLGAEEWERVTEAAGRLSGAGLWVDDTGALTLAEVRARARRGRREWQVGLVVLDYLQLLTAGGRREQRAQEVAEISRGLKALARELGVPVLALSQLNRAVESRTTGRPQLSDLRESGALEQDADLVLFLYRADRDEGGAIVELELAKHRNGPTGAFRLYFDRARQRFGQLER